MAEDTGWRLSAGVYVQRRGAIHTPWTEGRSLHMVAACQQQPGLAEARGRGACADLLEQPDVSRRPSKPDEAQEREPA